MIPKPRLWNVNVRDERNRVIATLRILTITRFMCKLIVRQDYPRYWGNSLTISPVRP